MLSELTILVIHYRTPALLRECLSRLNRYAADARIVVVDNDSQDESEQLLRRQFPDIRVLHAQNHSFSAAVNTGLKAATTPFVAHMNADVMIEVDTLPSLLEVLRSEHVGMVGPQAVTPQGNWQDQGPLYRFHHARLKRSQQPSLAVPWLSGCMQVLKREVIAQVGGMDSSLRFYNEDMEWCWRIRQAGYSCQLVKTSVLHIGGSSTPSAARFLIEGYRGGYKLSQRYKPIPYRLVHRLVVIAEVAWQRRYAEKLERRQAFDSIYQMFAAGDFDTSPFGATLREDNPRFNFWSAEKMIENQRSKIKD